MAEIEEMKPFSQMQRVQGQKKTKVLKILTKEDIKKISNTVSSWRKGEDYRDIKGFCKSSTTNEIKENEFALNTGRYIDLEDEESDGITFEENIINLSKELENLNKESFELSNIIKENLKKIVD